MGYPDRETVARVRAEFPPGTRVELVCMDDPQAPPAGTLGTVLCVDDIASLCMQWDNGSSLHVAYGEDVVRKVDQENAARTNELHIQIKDILQKSISSDYVEMILHRENADNHKTVLEDIADNVMETSALMTEERCSDDDIRLAIGRILSERLDEHGSKM